MRTLLALGALVLVIASCRMRQDPASEIRSLNSTIEDGEPAVFKILSQFPVLGPNGQQVLGANGMPRFNSGACTLTAYSPSHGITAAHCVVNQSTGQVVKPEHLRVLFPDASFALAKQVVPHPQWITERRNSAGAVTRDGSGRPTNFDSTKDIALVAFDNQFSEFKKMAPIVPAAGRSEVKIVGFGLRGYYHAELVQYITSPVLSDQLRDITSTLPAGERDYLNRMRTAYRGSGNPGEPYVSAAQRLKQHIDKIEGSLKADDGKFIKRSGITTLGGIANSIRDFTRNEAGANADGFLVFSGRFLQSVLKDNLDRDLFARLGVYAPDENEDPSLSATGLAASFGDSGGPLLTKEGHLAGVASHIRPDTERMTVHSAYVNLNSAAIRSFFDEQKGAGWSIPSLAETTETNPPEGGGSQDLNPAPPGGETQPGTEPQPNPDPNPGIAVPTNEDLAAALASAPDSNGNYHLLISAGQATDDVWICEKVSRLSDCATLAKATHSTGPSTFGPASRYNVRTDSPINILEPFAIVTLSPSGFISGIIVKGVRK